jgi:hypothetical protein
MGPSWKVAVEVFVIAESFELLLEEKDRRGMGLGAEQNTRRTANRRVKCSLFGRTRLIT